MDISCNLKTVSKCIRYLHKHPEAGEDFRALSRRYLETEGYDWLHYSDVCLTGCLLAVEDVPERYNDWVEHYYQMEEETQNLFSEYWFPIGGNLFADLSFIDLLSPYLPVIVLGNPPVYKRICVCRSLVKFIEDQKRKNSFYGKLFMKKGEYTPDYL